MQIVSLLNSLRRQKRFWAPNFCFLKDILEAREPGMREKCLYLEFFLSVFPAFGLNTERNRVSLRIQSWCGKIQNRKTPNTDTFYAVQLFQTFWKNLRNISLRNVLLPLIKLTKIGTHSAHLIQIFFGICP